MSARITRAVHALRRLRGNIFLRNLSSMGASQIVTRVSRLLTTIVLARSLRPEDYGLAAIVLTVYEIVAIFTRNGINARVVQAAPQDVERVARTAYWLTWIVCGALVLLQAAAAVPVSLLYHAPRIALPVALMGLIYLVTPLCNIQTAFMLREGRLGRIALAGLLQVTADNILTAILALCGLGMWAIVLPKLCVAPIWLVMTRRGHPWRMRGGFTLSGWRDIARFARAVLGVELLTTVQANIDNLIVGYRLGATALGTYYFAFNAGLGISLGLITAFSVAVFPHLCAAAGNPADLAARFLRTRRIVALVTMPLILAQAALAPFYVPLVFGAKWHGAVPALMLICLSALPRPAASVASQLLKAAGRPDIELRWQFAITLLLVAALFLGTVFGILGVACAVLAVQGVSLSAFALLAPRAVLRPAAPPRAAPVFLRPAQAVS